MKQRRWKEAEQQFEELRELPSDLAEEDKFHLRNAAGGGDEASKKDDDKTLKLDEYALVSAGNAAYYSALKEGLHKRSDPKIRQREDDHYKRAESLYKKALVKEPTNAFAANGLAILLAERGRMDDAKAVFTLVQESLEIENAGIAGTSASAATKILSELQADVLVNLGHIALAKAQYAASLKFYDRAQQEFYHGTSHEIMLFQARAHYENQNLLQAKKTLQEALHIAPMNHRVRFNLAYVVQELAQRSLNDTLKSVSSEGRVARVEKALENIQVALHMFTQLKELGNQPKFGFDTKRTTVHANFCKQALEKSKPHLEKAHAEEEKLMKSKKAQMEARKALEEGRANESWKRLPQKAREDSKRLACAGKRELKRGEAERITTQRMATTWRMAAKAPSSAEKAFPRRKRSRRRKRRKKNQRSQRRMVLRHPPRLRAARVRIRIRALPRIPTTTSIPKPPRRKNRKRKKRRSS
jgi:RNA polymerase-associated protein CTR9